MLTVPRSSSARLVFLLLSPKIRREPLNQSLIPTVPAVPLDPNSALERALQRLGVGLQVKNAHEHGARQAGAIHAGRLTPRQGLQDGATRRRPGTGAVLARPQLGPPAAGRGCRGVAGGGKEINRHRLPSKVGRLLGQPADALRSGHATAATAGGHFPPRRAAPARPLRATTNATTGRFLVAGCRPTQPADDAMFCAPASQQLADAVALALNRSGGQGPALLIRGAGGR